MPSSERQHGLPWFQATAAADTEEGLKLAEMEEELRLLGVSKALLAEAMEEKEEETVRRLREAKDKQVRRRFIVGIYTHCKSDQLRKQARKVCCFALGAVSVVVVAHLVWRLLSLVSLLLLFRSTR